eukprot:TRINITY_DN2323_c0_g1_i7.p1 TRINITY_DN2323_c0_g1~~TRINITY_DN2323_c0_g1_i7.p1  ORF type:complete len:1162 (-),score=270.09 TRINITY_DN2323_c0_g1_i7:7983-11468(-)
MSDPHGPSHTRTLNTTAPPLRKPIEMYESKSQNGSYNRMDERLSYTSQSPQSSASLDITRTDAQDDLIVKLEAGLLQTRELLQKERTIRSQMHSMYEEKLTNIDVQFRVLATRIESDSMLIANLTRERDEALAQLTVAHVSAEDLKVEMEHKARSVTGRKDEIDSALANLLSCASASGSETGRQILKSHESLSKIFGELLSTLSNQSLTLNVKLPVTSSPQLSQPQTDPSFAASESPMIAEINARLILIANELTHEKRMTSLYKYLEENPFHKLFASESRQGLGQIPRSISSLRLSQSQMSRVNPVVTSADSTGSHDRIQDMQGQLQLLEARLKSELAQKDVLLSANAALERDMLKHVKGSQKSGNVSRELMDVIEQQSHQYQRLRSLIQEENLQLQRHVEFLQRRLGEEILHKERNQGVAQQLQHEIACLVKVLETDQVRQKYSKRPVTHADLEKVRLPSGMQEDDHILSQFSQLQGDYNKVLARNAKLETAVQRLDQSLLEIKQGSRYVDSEKLRAELASKTARLDLVQHSYETALAEKEAFEEKYIRLVEDVGSYLEVARLEYQAIADVQIIRQALSEERNLRQGIQAEVAHIREILASVRMNDDLLSSAERDGQAAAQENLFSTEYMAYIEREISAFDSAYEGREEDSLISGYKIDHLKRMLLNEARLKFDAERKLEGAQKKLLRQVAQLEVISQEVDQIRKERSNLETEYKNLIKMMDEEVDEAPSTTARPSNQRQKTPTKGRSRSSRRSMSCGRIRGNSTPQKQSKESNDTGDHQASDSQQSEESETEAAVRNATPTRIAVKKRDPAPRTTRTSFKKPTASTSVTISASVERVISEDFDGFKKLFDTQYLKAFSRVETLSGFTSSIVSAVSQGIQRIEEFKEKTKGKKSSTIEFLESCFASITQAVREFRDVYLSIPTLVSLREPVETYSDELANKCRALYKQMIQFKADRQEFKEEAAALNEQFDQLATQFDEKSQAFNDLEIQYLELTKELQDLRRSHAVRAHDSPSALDSSFQNRSMYDGWSLQLESIPSPDRMVLQMQTIVSENAQQLRLAYEEIQQLREENTALWMEKDQRIDAERIQHLLDQLSSLATMSPPTQSYPSSDSVTQLLQRQRGLMDLLNHTLREKFDLRRLLRPQPFLAHHSFLNLGDHPS